MKLTKPVSISNSIIHLVDFVKANLADSSDEEEESPRNSQPTSEASEEFNPPTQAVKVSFYHKPKMGAMNIEDAHQSDIKELRVSRE